MFTYNNQPILDVTHLVPGETLVKLDREIVAGLARSQKIFHSVGHELTRGDAELSLYNHDFKDVGLAEKELESWEIEEMSTMSYAEKQRFLRFAKGAYHPWSVCLPLTTNSHWQLKMSPTGKSATDEAKVLFPKTLEFVGSLKIFESIGRVCIFGVDPAQHVTCHRDFDPKKWPINNELLMLSPRGGKKFYIYDQETQARHYLPEHVRAYIFHDLNYHGVDPLPYFTYTLRIDGVYTEEFRNTLTCNRPSGEFRPKPTETPK